MTKVSRWLSQIKTQRPLDSKCAFGRYKNQEWKTICEKDPEWILWLISDSKVLIPRVLEVELIKFLGKHDFDSDDLD